MLSLLALLAGTGVNAQSDPLGGSPNTKALRGSRPNVVIFFIDDTGWGDYSFNDPSMDDTPHLQRLRERGMRLSDFHAAASVCTPSRASLMTGRLGIRSGVKGNFGPFSVAGLPMNETTIPEVLRDAGYVSAMAGKWHLGHNAPHGPLHRGFDRFLGLPMSHDYGCTDKPGYDMDCPKIQQDICSPPGGLSAADDKSCHIGPNNPWNMSIPLYKGNSIAEQPTDLDILSDRYAAFARDFVVNSTAEGKPFFLYIAWNHMHVPVGNHKPKFTNTSKRGVYGDSLRQLDESIGIVVDAITGSGAENNTLILLTGDNGAPDDQCDYGGSNGPFMGAWLRKNAPGGGTGKTTTWEGGHREPGLAVWPGTIPENSDSAVLSSTLDYMPTIAHLAGVPLPPHRIFDGVNLGPALFDGASQVRDTLFHPNSGCEGQIGAIETLRVNATLKIKYRTGGKCVSCDRKLAPDTFHDPPLIFDLIVDPGESTPIEPSNPRHAIAVDMAKTALAALQQSVVVDNTTIADYETNRDVKPCCNPKDRLCRCQQEGSSANL